MLHNNKLTGSIPTDLGGLIELRDLWLNNNKLSGSLPTELGKLTQLVDLFVETNVSLLVLAWLVVVKAVRLRNYYCGPPTDRLSYIPIVLHLSRIIGGPGGHCPIFTWRFEAPSRFERSRHQDRRNHAQRSMFFEGKSQTQICGRRLIGRSNGVRLLRQVLLTRRDNNKARSHNKFYTYSYSYIYIGFESYNYDPYLLYDLLV